jgi:hypothetical protein
MATVFRGSQPTRVEHPTRVQHPTRTLDQSSTTSRYWNEHNPFPAYGSFGLPPSIDSELKRILSLKGIDAKESITWKYLIKTNQFEITEVDGVKLQQPMYITPDDSAIYVAGRGRKKRSTKRKGNKKRNRRTNCRKI